jgi:hypothetical protein
VGAQLANSMNIRGNKVEYQLILGHENRASVLKCSDASRFWFVTSAKHIYDG